MGTVFGPPNSTETRHNADERICACDAVCVDDAPSDAVVCVRPVCDGNKTDDCRCADGQHTHGPPDALDTEWSWGILRDYNVRELCHPTGLRHVDPGCADSGGT